MPFTNEVIGTNGVLIRNWLQSQNYVPGTSGWQITKDGNAEFNNGTFRGSIEVGSLSGQHFIVNNSTTGDVVDIYDSSGRLIFSIDSNGILTSYNYSGGSTAGHLRISGADATFNNNSGFITTDPPHISSPDITSSGTELELYSGTPNGSLSASSIQLFGGTTAAQSEARVTARGVNGDILQLDNSNNNSQLVHVGSYSGSVVDAFGDIQINHGALFTPRFGFLQAWDVNAVGQGWQLEWFQNPFSSTQMSFFVRNQSGGIPPVGTTVGVHAVLFG